jgi:hypothetical protein
MHTTDTRWYSKTVVETCAVECQMPQAVGSDYKPTGSHRIDKAYASQEARSKKRRHHCRRITQLNGGLVPSNHARRRSEITGASRGLNGSAALNKGWPENKKGLVAMCY